MNFKKILIIGIDKSKLDSDYWKKIESFADEIVFIAKDSNEINSQLKDTDCLLLNFGVKIDKNDIHNAPKLQYIGVLATAYGKVDTQTAKEKEIIVSNIPGYSTESVAEFVIGALLECMRELGRGREQAKHGNYSESGFSATEIKGKHFGVLGLGRIGSRVAEIAQGFGANVNYWSKERKPEMEKRGIKFQEISKLIESSDIISINLAQAKETENLLSEKEFQKMKSGTIIINTAPMEIVNIQALENRLKKGNIFFIADHSDEMGEEKNQLLSKYKNCILYPPIAYLSAEARIAKQEIFISNIENFLKGKPTNTV